jgi:Amidase
MSTCRSAASAVERRESEVHAWVFLDSDGALDAAKEIDTGPERPLRGVALVAKDVFDTADLPTGYGSPILAGFRPRADAAAVALLRATPDGPAYPWACNSSAAPTTTSGSSLSAHGWVVSSPQSGFRYRRRNLTAGTGIGCIAAPRSRFQATCRSGADR